jgi:hypothetical protein
VPFFLFTLGMYRIKLGVYRIKLHRSGMSTAVNTCIAGINDSKRADRWRCACKLHLKLIHDK